MREKERWLNRQFIVGPHLAICFTEGEFRRILKKLDVPRDSWCRWINDGADATTHTLTNKEKSRIAVVCIDTSCSPDPVAVAGLLVHEAVHVWQRHMQAIGEDAPSLEFEAYSIQAISQALMWEYVDYLKEKERAESADRKRKK